MPNYFSPAFRIEVDGSRLAADVSKNIQQVTVVSRPSAVDTFTLTVANAYPKLPWTHTSDADLFKVGADVSIEMGYVDQMRNVMRGEITKLSPVFPESGVPTIGVEGHTRLHWLHGSKKTRTFQRMTDKQIVERIAQEVGLRSKAEDTQVTHEYIMQANQTDLEFVQARARRIHFEILIEDDRTLVFRRSKEDEPKAYTLVWGQVHEGFSPPADMLPLKSFSPTMTTMNQPDEVIVRGYNPQTKREVIGRARVGDEVRRLGDSAGPEMTQRAFNRQQQVVNVGPVSSQAEADQQARAIYNERAMQFLEGSGATIGEAGLRSGMIVDLQGLGPKFSGLYYIDEATHTLGGSGYQTSFTVKRNAAQ
jgi:uncharacterized protein